MKEVISFLEQFHPLSTNLKDFLQQKLHNISIPRKQLLLRPGEAAHHIWFIRKGLFRSYYTNNNREVCSKFFRGGDIMLAASGFFLRKESEEFLEALEESAVAVITRDDLEFIYQHFPEFNLHARILLTQAFLQSEKRITLLRYNKAADRYKALMKEDPDLITRVASRHLASYLNISEGTISRIRAGKY